MVDSKPFRYNRLDHIDYAGIGSCAAQITKLVLESKQIFEEDHTIFDVYSVFIDSFIHLKINRTVNYITPSKDWSEDHTAVLYDMNKYLQNSHGYSLQRDRLSICDDYSKWCEHCYLYVTTCSWEIGESKIYRTHKWKDIIDQTIELGNHLDRILYPSGTWTRLLRSSKDDTKFFVGVVTALLKTCIGRATELDQLGKLYTFPTVEGSRCRGNMIRKIMDGFYQVGIHQLRLCYKTEILSDPDCADAFAPSKPAFSCIFRDHR